MGINLSNTIKTEYLENGFYLLKHVISKDKVTELIASLNVFNQHINHYGIRNLNAKIPVIRQFAHSDLLASITKNILGEHAKPVRSVFFDKTPQANWNVAWHQDTSIAVTEKASLSGFKHWKEKQGVIHVEPPETFLSSLLTLRIHLDASDSNNGVLRVIPKSHRHGRIHAKTIAEIIENTQAMECNAETGDILLMNPLLLHSSRKAKHPLHRRIIHLEYSAKTLPKPLSWYETSSA